jgi:hypothetical protein
MTIREIPWMRAIRIVLLGFVAVTVAVVVVRNLGHGPPVAAEKRVPHQVIVFYLHDNQRCEACERVERFSREAVASFGDAVRDGILEWRDVNRTAPENEQYVRKFHVVTQTVVVANLHDGQMTEWKVLDDVLNRHEDREAFVSYLQEHIRAYVEGR